jgi:hypothetical protein
VEKSVAAIIRVTGIEHSRLENVVRQWLAFLRLALDAEGGLIEELAQHLEDRYRERRARETNEAMPSRRSPWNWRTSVRYAQH